MFNATNDYITFPLERLLIVYEPAATLVRVILIKLMFLYFLSE